MTAWYIPSAKSRNSIEICAWRSQRKAHCPEAKGWRTVCFSLAPEAVIKNKRSSFGFCRKGKWTNMNCPKIRLRHSKYHYIHHFYCPYSTCKFSFGPFSIRRRMQWPLVTQFLDEARIIFFKWVANISGVKKNVGSLEHTRQTFTHATWKEKKSETDNLGNNTDTDFSLTKHKFTFNIFRRISTSTHIICPGPSHTEKWKLG